MAADWTCPNCNGDFDSGRYPDHWREGRQFNFECDHCGATFDVDVDWSPQFYVRSDSVRVRDNSKAET